MVRGQWIFLSFIAVLTIVVYFESGLFWIVLIGLIIRIIVIKNKYLVLFGIFISIIFIIRCQIEQKQNSISEINSALISPDKITVNGNLLSGELRDGDRTARFTYQLKNRTEQKLWQNLSELVDIKLKVKEIIPISGPRNIGEFNFQKYMKHKRIESTIRIASITQISEHHPIKTSERINVLRIHMIKYFDQLPKWLSIHAKSLIVGYTDSSNKDFLVVLSSLGIIHLFSLSGLHVLILLSLLRKLTSALKIPIEIVDTIMLFLLPCYGLLVGSKSGIWRAIVLAIVGIVVRKLKISLGRLDTFSITLLICILVYPFGIAEMGGQLSFLLSFAILYLYQEAGFIMTIFKMNLVNLPVICLYIYQFNWLTLLANFVFVPFFTVVILPVTIISSFTVTWSGWKFFNLFFDQIYKLLDLVAKRPNFTFITGKIPIFAVIVLIIISLFYIESKNFWNKYLWQYCVLFIICIIFNKFPLYGSVNLIDVGQGDSILITTPISRQTILIDVGGKLSFPTKEWEKRVTRDQVSNSTIPLLKSKGISKIDKVFLTHKDVDHIGNLETLLTGFKVKEVNFGIGLEKNKRISNVINNYPKVKFKNLRQGDTVDIGGIKLNVLWPKKSSIGENEDSLTMIAKLKNKTWLFTGDLDQAGEKEILKDYNLKIDYLKVGHHGSKTSTSKELLQQSRPQRAFISSGVNNRYGHPNKETIDRLKQQQIEYFNTADYGMISWYYFFFNNNEKTTTFLKGDLVENSRTKK